jgi:pyruvate kinase, alpha/beta domain protein
MIRNSKIIATIGDATDKVLRKIVEGAADAVLIDSYYGSNEQNVERIEKVKALREEVGRDLAIIYDVDHIYAKNKYKLIRIDEENVDFACLNDVDFVACPFVGNLEEITKVKELIKSYGKNIGIIVKIDCKDGYDNLDDILEIADAIMINRDELGVDISYEDLPGIQKEIVRRANEATKVVILTTQMLYSMVYNPRPTRAEVSDVANAIFDGVDAVMLTEETAIGDYPCEALETVDRIIRTVEKNNAVGAERFEVEGYKMSISHAVSMTTKHLLEAVDVKSIVTYTKSGTTARFIARYRPNVPVLAVLPDRESARKLVITRGIVPYIEPKMLSMEEMLSNASLYSKKVGLAEVGDSILITAGQPDTGKGTVPPTDFVYISKVD